MTRTHLTRREWLKPMAGAAAFLALHDQWIASAFSARDSVTLGMENFTTTRHGGADEVRIQKLRLQTAAPLTDMRRFYEEVIGFKIISADDAELRVRTGKTDITFVAVKSLAEGLPGDDNVADVRKPREGEPFYHFAFNIPQNKILAARNWQLERTKLVPTPPNLQDPKFPTDVRHFANWNAHSVFFFDPAFNIVEYIARHELKNDGEDPDTFSVEDILYASEIGFICDADDREAIAGNVRKNMGLSEYPQGSSPWAMGDERGLLLILGRLGTLWGENTDTPVRWGIFPTEATIAGPASPTGTFNELPYVVHSTITGD